ncbi:unnamed protein product [Nesidiocoris tenuis]|uniref:Protein THEM6 n=1 Tax=Nesidiocoris tenuis TaxID=355587 RepID=A0A6H5H9A9_9HEMI|nr:unnamed protein product [Nesidiocoris tenuis]
MKKRRRIYTGIKDNLLEAEQVNRICLTTDVDHLLSHMNNARFLREIDFARADFYQRTGLYGAIRSKGGSVLQGSSTIRYRKFITLFSIYHIQWMECNEISSANLRNGC